MRSRYWPLKALKIAVIAVVAAAVVGLVVMSLWNWLVPALFGRPTISFAEAIGLFILAKLLFGGFRGGVGPGHYWRRRMHERWEQMSPEERERFRAGMQRCCGYEARGAAADSSQQPPAATP